MRASQVIALTSRKLFPVTLLFGLYLLVNGHLSPGGGFQGGVVIGSALILADLSQEKGRVPGRFTDLRCSVAEAVFAAGLVTYLVWQVVAGLSSPQPSAVPPVLLANLAIGLKVGMGTWLLYRAMLGVLG